MLICSIKSMKSETYTDVLIVRFLSMMDQMIEQDTKLRDDFINGLVADPALVQNLKTLGIIPRGDQ